MSCALTQGYTLDCADGIGGIKKIYVTELANKSTLTEASGVVTAFTLSSGKKFWAYDLIKETGNFTEDQTKSVANGTVFYDQKLTFTIRKLQASLQQELRLLAQNDLMIIVLDRNGIYWLLGKTNGVDLITRGGASGTAMGDMNGYTLNFEGKEERPMPQVSSGLIAALTSPA
jgi:hypothetical protein